MAKSLRSKRKKRLRTLRREIVGPFYDKKEEAKLNVQEAALSAPKLPVRVPKNKPESMDVISDADPAFNSMEVEMAHGGSGQSKLLLKPVGGVGKKTLKKKLQLKKDQLCGREAQYITAGFVLNSTRKLCFGVDR